MKKFIHIRGRLIFSFFFLLPLCILTSSCNVANNLTKKLIISNDVKSNDNVIDSELKRNRELWAENDIYSYQMIVECSGNYSMGIGIPVDIEIKDGGILNIDWSLKDKNEKMTQGQKEIIQRQYENYVSSVEKLFNFIELKNNYIKEGIRLTKRADGILNVSYNSQTGYPEQINYQSVGTHGDMLFRIKKFEILNSKNS